MTASVTVVIPCFRCIQTIGRALQSVAEQTLRPNEVILLDDGSGDGTLDVLQKNIMKYGREWIKVIALKENSGPAAVRNIGWQNAASEYVAFLDADDAWHSKKVEIQYNWMKSHPKAILTAHLCSLLQDGMRPKPLPEQWKVQRINPRMLLRSNRFITPTVMLRRDIPFRFPATQRYSEDYLLWMQIVMAGNESYILNVPLAFLFKAKYGASGLSADLWRMEEGELSNYRKLYNEGVLSFGGYYCQILYSWVKYFLRCIRTRIRKRRIY